MAAVDGALVAELLEDETVSGDRLVQLAAAEKPSSVPADWPWAEV